MSIRFTSYPSTKETTSFTNGMYVNGLNADTMFPPTTDLKDSSFDSSSPSKPVNA